MVLHTNAKIIQAKYMKVGWTEWKVLRREVMVVGAMMVVVVGATVVVVVFVVVLVVDVVLEVVTPPCLTGQPYMLFSLGYRA